MNKYLKASFILPFIGVMGFFIYWLFTYYIFHDLVWDELVSLKNFVLVDVKTTVTHYPDVNNHLLFNLLNNFYCQIIGIGNIYEAMDHVVKMRVYTVFISLFTIFFSYKASSKFFGTNAGFMTAIILLTCIPFLNFTMQLRGYSMSMTFMAMLVYAAWSFEKKSHWAFGLLVLLAVFGILYAIPSNIYFVIAIGLYYFIQWILKSRIRSKVSEQKNALKDWLRTPDFYLLLFIGFGAVLAFLAYLPILEDLLNERHLQQLKGKSFYGHTLKNVIPYVLHYILSYRFLLLIPFLVVFVPIIGRLRKNDLTESDKKIIFLISIVLLSFIVSLVRGDKPHQRTFTPLAVVISILLGSASSIYFNGIKSLKSRQLISFSVIFIYSVATFFFCDNLIQNTLRRSIIKGDKVYNMFYNFYQSQEYGMKNLDVLIEDAQKTGYPILMAKEIDRVAEGEYLLKNDLAYYGTVWAKQSQAQNESGYEYQVLMEIAQGKGQEIGYNRFAYPPGISKDQAMLVPLFSFLYQNKVIDQQIASCYVITFAPNWFEGIMKSGMPAMKYKRLNKKKSYHNVYLITPKESSFQ